MRDIVHDVMLAKLSGEDPIPNDVQQVLHDQSIDEDQPGTILRDFRTLLEFIGVEGLKTTGKHFLLPQSRLQELNERMSRPLVHQLKRPQQRSFPHLHGLFLILRASGIGIGKGGPPNGRLMVDPELMTVWLNLNPTERYFTLLDAWLLQSRPEIIGEREHWLSEPMFNLRDLMWRLRERETPVPAGPHNGVMIGMTDFMVLALMEQFGWVHLEYRAPQKGGGPSLAAVERLPFGDAMLSVMLMRVLYGRVASLAKQKTRPETLRPILQPYFPEWRRVLEPSEPPARRGTFTWRASVGQAWRRIVAPANLTLDALAHAILGAFDFDCDHLYCFKLKDARGRSRRIACPYEQDAEEWTDEVTLGELRLPEGDAMTFHFDYGDDWRFQVKLERVNAERSKHKGAKVTAQGGEAPSQYESYDGEDDW
jgi:hypothetical protein